MQNPNSCPRCGASNRLGAKYCQHCRAPLSVNTGTKTCPQCQIANRANARFCANCGHVFSSSALLTLRHFLASLVSEKTIPLTLSGMVVVVACLLLALAVVTWAYKNNTVAQVASTSTLTSTALPANTRPVPTLTILATATITNGSTQIPITSTALPRFTTTPILDGLEQAKRGTVLIVVPNDATPGKSVSGSGSVITKKGHILTNYHLFVDDRDKPYSAKGEIAIWFPSRDNLKGRVEQYYRAVMVKADPQHDLALIQIKFNKDGTVAPADLGLSVIPIGDSDKVDSGDVVTILGFPGLGGDTLTLTRGTVAGFLPDDGYIKTDAEINPGNSGGPAFNATYQQIGIASAVYVSKSQTVPGKIGWIRPVSFAKSLIDLAKSQAGE